MSYETYRLRRKAIHGAILGAAALVFNAAVTIRNLQMVQRWPWWPSLGIIAIGVVGVAASGVGLWCSAKTIRLCNRAAALDRWSSILGTLAGETGLPPDEEEEIVELERMSRLRR